jgi:hypothetical protein
VIDRATLQAMTQFPDQLEAFYSAVPTGYENWRPASWDGVPSEPFTAIEQICHVRDIEIDGYHVRLRRTLAEAHPHLVGIDSEALAVERRYAQADVADVLATFRQARSETLAIIGELSEIQWQRTAFFEGYGDLSLRGLVHYLSSHDQQHLAGLQWLLGKIDAHRAVEKRMP